MNNENTQTAAEVKPSFMSSVRQIVWPVFGKEHMKFLPMTFIISAILFNYTILRNMKDTLVNTAVKSADLIPTLKGFVVLPSAILAFLVLTKLFNMFSKEKVFYIVISFFLAFFAIFAFVLYPNQAALQPEAFASSLAEILPNTKLFINIVNIIKHWSFSLFYLFSELWGSVVATLLFWQFANSIVQVKEAKRFYGHFYLLANLATASSGIIGREFSNLGSSNYQLTINYSITSIIVVGLAIMMVYYWMHKCIVTNPNYVAADQIKPKKKKVKLSVKDSVKFIFSSPYLGLIALLVLSYGVSINLIEVVWKGKMAEYFHLVSESPDAYKAAYGAFMNGVTFYTGISTFFVILIGGYFVRMLGWRFGALATPVIIGLTGGAFFFFIISGGTSLEPASTEMVAKTLWTVIFIGAVQNILSKSTKYALFDPTKEMAYIPLDDESKSKGKAAVDVVGGRLGKAGGGYILNIFFLFTTAGVSGLIPALAFIVLGIIGVWIFAVLALYKRFVALGGEEQEPAQEKAPAKQEAGVTTESATA